MRTILHVFATFSIGGPQMRFVQVANHFGRRYRHLIVAMDGRTEAASLLCGETDARLIPIAVRRNDTLANVWTFSGMLRTLRPDLLVTSNWGSIEWALANLVVGVPHLHMEDGFGPQEADRQIARRVWTRRVALLRSSILLPSQTLYALARRHWRMRESQLLYVPNGIDCDRFARDADWTFAESLGLARGGPVIGTVAALRPEKNLRRLVEAFATVTERFPARLLIIGEGAERPGLEQRAAELGLRDRVIFAGHCAEPEKLLPCLDAFVLSSDTEQMPLSVLEAMAAGRPVAATGVGDVANMVAEENRPFVVPRDTAALADAIAMLLADPARARTVGAANARRAREQFAQQRMFDAFQRLFDGALAGAR